MLSNDLQDEFGDGYASRREARYDAQASALLFLGHVGKTIRDRGESYGPPAEHWTRTAALYTAILGPKLRAGKVITAREVALLYIADKLSRDVATPKEDNVLDIAGYAAGIATLGEA